MRAEAPGLLPILRSRHQADLLTLLLLHPEQDYTIAELARRLSIPQSTVSVEVQRLTYAGILAARAAGRVRIVRANPDSPLVPPLTELLILTFGPKVVVADEFAELDGVTKVLIFGSWAARYRGERGRPPHDVDVLVVGSPDRLAMYAAAQRAEARLGRQVNPVACQPDQWDHPTEPFILEIQARPFVVAIDTTTSTPGEGS
jgi:predicted nucleotidyltransferase